MKLLSFHQELLEAFGENKVRYLIVGGYAVSIHGYVRATLDLDIWIENKKDNLEKIVNSFITIGYKKKDAKESIEAVLSGKNISLFDNDNNKIDIIHLYSTNLSFDDAFKRKYDFFSEELVVHVIGLNDLIDTKIRAGRSKDWEDIRQLKAIDELRRGRDKA